MDCWWTLHDGFKLYFYFNFDIVSFVQHDMVENLKPNLIIMK